MIRCRTLRGIAVLLALAIVSWLLARDPARNDKGPVADLDTRLNYALIDFSADLLDENGAVSAQLEAPFLRNNASSGIGTVENPNIRVLQGDDLWHISAESAIITTDREFITMAGAVQMTRKNELTGMVLHIDTRDVVLAVTPRTATSDAAVNLQQAGDHLEAVGLNLDIINNSYELLSQVHGTYATP